MEAEAAYKSAQARDARPAPYHLVLDEMNLARVEYYFAKFLSRMEEKKRDGTASIRLGPDQEVLLPPNLIFIGTVNIDETTHAFADKVYDRAQLIEMRAPRGRLEEHVAGAPHAEAIMEVYDAIGDVAPFAFRVLDEIAEYVDAAQVHGSSWEEALDEQLLQKVLPKVKGTEPKVGEALSTFLEVAPEDTFPLSQTKARRMLEDFKSHGFTSYF
jgi:5-methylcytosine-specific restriction endonuclease McrBC GTP-binding regulatory subunit McrB